MIALHEQEIERRVWLSTDVPDEFLSLSPIDDRDERLPTFAHDDDVLSALEPDESTWEDTDMEETSLEDALRRRWPRGGRPRQTMCSPSILVRYAVLPCSALPRNKRLGDASNAGSGASAGLYTLRQWPCRRCSGASIG